MTRVLGGTVTMTDVMTRTRVDPLAAENAHLLNGQGYLLLLDDREMIGV
jgi:hypothetical protein